MDEAKKEDMPQKDGAQAPTMPVAMVTVLAKNAAGDKTLMDGDHRFHVPSLRATVAALEDGCTIKIAIKATDDVPERVLVEGAKDAVLSTLEKAIIPTDKVATEFHKFATFVLEHSELRGVGVHAIVSDGEHDSGFGFVTTADNCTQAQAITLVNCGDANINEFIAKSGIVVPGRQGQEAGSDGIIRPTADQVENLG